MEWGGGDYDHEPADLLCNCSSEGVVDPDDCDGETGQCSCLPGYTGLQCEDCEDGHFSNGSTGCLHCGCDSYGAINDRCNRLPAVLDQFRVPTSSTPRWLEHVSRSQAGFRWACGCTPPSWHTSGLHTFHQDKTAVLLSDVKLESDSTVQDRHSLHISRSG
ncbi:hypothetical protein SKAU_G00278620 [Synaphobranchus kaupii]|uniref:Laminin EGF-like domain-containing protein n=1 Tax=Synaphobranchus kaupii TaxID=118154 RepID=A0A9Q1EWL9_SYNKA|nr:hypothetical protein SKAU_G00278620 [Synaphobranchus kaupii]